MAVSGSVPQLLEQTRHDPRRLVVVLQLPEARARPQPLQQQRSRLVLQQPHRAAAAVVAQGVGLMPVLEIG
jgi:hypothetical protein